MKKLLLLFLSLFSFVTISAQSAQKIHYQKGKLLGNYTDTLYARVLPNEVLFIDCQIRGIKPGISFKVLNMGNKVIYEKEGFKRERIRLPLREGQEVVKIVIHNPTEIVGKFFLEVNRLPAQGAPTEIDQTIYWMDVIDTTFKWIDKPYYTYRDTALVKLLEETRKVHSVTSLYDNEDCVSFRLPEHTIAWSYYIGVDQQGSQAYESAVAEMASLTSKMVKVPFNITPLAGLMAYGVQAIVALQSGEDIDFAVVDNLNAAQFREDLQFKSLVEGRMINGTRAFNDPLIGEWNICLENDNFIDGVSVLVIVEALVRPYTVEYKKEKIIDNITTRKTWFVR